MNDPLPRLLANALWRGIRERRWRGPRSSRTLEDYSGGGALRSIAGGTVHNSERRDRRIMQTQPEALTAIIEADERNGLPGRVFAVLWRDTFLRALTEASQSARDDLELAIGERAGMPYGWHQNGRGEWHLERLYDPWITPHVYRFLRELVELATVWSEEAGDIELIEDLSSDTRKAV